MRARCCRRDPTPHLETLVNHAPSFSFLFFVTYIGLWFVIGPADSAVQFVVTSGGIRDVDFYVMGLEYIRIYF